MDLRNDRSILGDGRSSPIARNDSLTGPLQMSATVTSSTPATPIGVQVESPASSRSGASNWFSKSPTSQQIGVLAKVSPLSTSALERDPSSTRENANIEEDHDDYENDPKNRSATTSSHSDKDEREPTTMVQICEDCRLFLIFAIINLSIH